jgi:hypothetical protein
LVHESESPGFYSDGLWAGSPWLESRQRQNFPIFPIPVMYDGYWRLFPPRKSGRDFKTGGGMPPLTHVCSCAVRQRLRTGQIRFPNLPAPYTTESWILPLRLSLASVDRVSLCEDVWGSGGIAPQWSASQSYRRYRFYSRLNIVEKRKTFCPAGYRTQIHRPYSEWNSRYTAWDVWAPNLSVMWTEWTWHDLGANWYLPPLSEKSQSGQELWASFGSHSGSHQCVSFSRWRWK